MSISDALAAGLNENASLPRWTTLEAPLSRASFYVVLDCGKWKIKYGHRVIGPYASREHAITAAVDAAQESACLSHASLVRVQDEDGRLRTLWTYGKDPYPPAE